MTGASAAVLSQAILSGRLKRLHALSFYDADTEQPPLVLDCLKAVGRGDLLPAFQYFQPVLSRMDDEMGEGVIAALTEPGSWPHVRRVILPQKNEQEFSTWVIRGGRLDGDEPEKGGPVGASQRPGVQILTLPTNDASLTMKWLLRALQQGALPKFRMLSMSSVPTGEDEVTMNALIDVMRSRGPEVLREFNICLMGGRRAA